MEVFYIDAHKASRYDYAFGKCKEHSLYDEYEEYTYSDSLIEKEWSSPNIFIHIKDDIPEDDIINIREEDIEKYNKIYDFVRHGNYICTDILLRRWEMCKENDEPSYAYYNRITQDMLIGMDYFHYPISRLKFGNSKNIIDIYKRITSCFPVNYADVHDGKNFYFSTPSCLHFQLVSPEKICDFDALPTQAKRVNQHNRIYCKFLSKVINENFEEKGIAWRDDANGIYIYCLLKRYLKTHEKGLFKRMYSTLLPYWSASPSYTACKDAPFREPTKEEEEDFDLIIHPAYIRRWNEQVSERRKYVFNDYDD